MKKLLLSILTLFMLSIAMSAKDAKNRTVSDLKKITAKCPKTNNLKIGYIGAFYAIKQFNCYSLRSINEDKLNQLEKDLIANFKDVIVCAKGGNFHQCYYLIDNQNRKGAVKLDGTVLVPPVAGGIHWLLGDYMIFGETSYNDYNWLCKEATIIQQFNGAGFGHFQAVVKDVKNDKIKPLVSLGQYDDIMACDKSGRFSFFVAKLNDDNSLRWGYINSKGELEIPCEWKSIFKHSSKASKAFGGVSGKMVPSNEYTMEQAIMLVENKEALAKAQREALAESLNNFAKICETSASIVNTVNQMRGKEENDYSSSISGGSYAQMYRQWEKRAESNYNSLTNLGHRVTSDTGDKGGTTRKTSDTKMSSSTYTSMKKALRDAQTEMKKIREKASKKGISIAQSKWETATVIF